MSRRGRQDVGRRVVAIGGGTGLPVVLTALKHYLGTCVADLTAVVTEKLGRVLARLIRHGGPSRADPEAEPMLPVAERSRA